MRKFLAALRADVRYVCCRCIVTAMMSFAKQLFEVPLLAKSKCLRQNAPDPFRNCALTCIRPQFLQVRDLVGQKAKAGMPLLHINLQALSQMCIPVAMLALQLVYSMDQHTDVF